MKRLCSFGIGSRLKKPYGALKSGWNGIPSERNSLQLCASGEAGPAWSKKSQALKFEKGTNINKSGRQDESRRNQTGSKPPGACRKTVIDGKSVWTEKRAGSSKLIMRSWAFGCLTELFYDPLSFRAGLWTALGLSLCLFWAFAHTGGFKSGRPLDHCRRQ